MESETTMTGVVTALQGILNTEQMFTNLGVLIPVLGGILIFSFTYRIIRRMIKGAPKAKVNL